MKVVSALPSTTPTIMPTAGPTESPTSGPTGSPIAPTGIPTAATTSSPTGSSTAGPTVSPTQAPTAMPTVTLRTAPPSSSIPTSNHDRAEDPASAIRSSSGLKIDWMISQSGQDADGGWIVSEDGMNLRFNVEASDFCHEGTNYNTQKGKAVATISLPEETDFSYVLGGMGESLDTGYEMMTLSVDRVVLATSTSRAIGKECSSNPVLVTYDHIPPYKLGPGKHVLIVDFTTADDYDHYGTYWTVDFTFGR